MNILFFLTPKASCAYLYEDFTIRQALECMENAGFAALPILARDGSYHGTLNEGDLLWALKNLCSMDMKRAEERGIMEIAHRRDNQPVSVTTDVEDLMAAAIEQNFVPVIDDKGAFIGIVTRKAIMQDCLDHYQRQRKRGGIQTAS